jgi:hypothetical protein
MTLKERPQAAYYHTAWKPKENLSETGWCGYNGFDQAIGTDHWQNPPMADTWDLPLHRHTVCSDTMLHDVRLRSVLLPHVGAIRSCR